MRTIARRVRRLKAAEPVWRTPPEISDSVYAAFGELAHRAKLTEGTPQWAHRIIREESFTKQELLELEGIINGDLETSALSAEILGAEQTLSWIKSALEGEIKPVGYAVRR
jgi:hypothetical protein